jgi:hypothetical protein
MTLGNAVVSSILRSPAHRLLSRAVDLVRYRRRSTGEQVSTPTQYARIGDDLIILVGRPDSKRWWHNFRTDHDLEVLVQGRWREMTGRAIVGNDEPDAIAPLLSAYLERFPKTSRLLGSDPELQRQQAVIVWCRPRTRSP